MKAFITILIFFIAFSFIGYSVLTGLFGVFFLNEINSNLIYTPFGGSNDLRLEEAENQKDLDIMFIGSSHCYRSFDPRNFAKYGWKTFNLGSSSQTHVQTNYILKKYLNEMKPKLVVYEVFPSMFMSDGIESTINLLSSSPNLDYNLLESAVKSKNVKVFNSGIFSIFLNVTNLKSKINKSKSRREIDKYIKGGYVERKLSFNEEKVSTELWEPLSYQLKYFDKNIELLKDNGIPYILVQTPYTMKYSNFKEIDDYFDSKGLYYNFNTLLHFNNKSDFYDAHHLNRIGVKKLNSRLIEKIKEDKLIN